MSYLFFFELILELSLKKRKRVALTEVCGKGVGESETVRDLGEELAGENPMKHRKPCYNSYVIQSETE